MYFYYEIHSILISIYKTCLHCTNLWLFRFELSLFISYYTKRLFVNNVHRKKVNKFIIILYNVNYLISFKSNNLTYIYNLYKNFFTYYISIIYLSVKIVIGINLNVHKLFR